MAEELGYARCPLPVHSGLAQVDAALWALGDAGAKHREELRRGTTRYALCAHDGLGSPAWERAGVIARAAPDGSWRLSGRARFVPYADSADVFLLPARLTTGPGRRGLLLAAVPATAAGLRLTTHRTLSEDHLGDVDLAEVVLRPDQVLAQDDTGGRDSDRAGDRNGGDDGDGGGDGAASRALAAALAMGTMALSAELTGLAAGLLRAAIDHARARTAFGQPLAAFQAVRHRAADMYLDVLCARDATAAACDVLTTTAPEPLDDHARAVVAAAKVTATAAALRAATGAHQLCGGWGHLDDAGLHHYTRAVKAAEGQLGSPSFHRATIAHHLRGCHPAPAPR